MIRFLWVAVFAVCANAANRLEYTRFCAGCKIWGADTVASHSGQFVVHGRSVSKPRIRQTNTNAPVLINIEPQILAVTAERTKRAFLQELLLPEAYQEKIHAIVLDFAPPQQPIQLISEVYLDGFQYRLAVPGQLEHTRLIRGLTQVLLLELANRGSRRSAELPRWLIEGMTWQVLSSAVPTYVVNEESASVEVVGLDRLSYTRAYLSTNSPMTVQELSFYDGNPADEKRFEACAHMLVHELLRLKGGPALMTQFIRTLPHALNWQTAFFSVYGKHFSGSLAFEKWWMLAWIDQKDRSAQEIWPLETSLERLNAMLLTSVELRMNTNSIPRRRDVSLQELLTDSDFNIQKMIISQKVQQLFFLAINLPAELRAVAHSYRETLESYLQQRSNNATQPGLKYDPEQRVQTLVRGTVKTLEELDRAREDVKQGRPVNARLLARRQR